MSLVRYKKKTIRRKLRHHECDVGLCRCAAVPVVVVGVVVVSVLLVVDGFTPQSTTQQLPKDLSRPNECCRRPTTSTTTTLLPQHTSQQRRQQQQSGHCNVKRPRQVLTRRLLAASEEQPSSSLSISQNSPQRHRTTRSMRSTKATTVSRRTIFFSRLKKGLSGSYRDETDETTIVKQKKRQKNRPWTTRRLYQSFFKSLIKGIALPFPSLFRFVSSKAATTTSTTSTADDSNKAGTSDNPFQVGLTFKEGLIALAAYLFHWRPGLLICLGRLVHD